MTNISRGWLIALWCIGAGATALFVLMLLGIRTLADSLGFL